MKKQPRWISTGVVGLLAGLLLGAGVAQAHVTVWPRESAGDASELYTVRVPTEKGVDTVQVRLEFPEGVVVSRFVPAPGWQKEVTRDAAGRITAVTWSGGRIAPDELGLFQFQARNPKAGQVAFKAYQTYADKSVVEWTGPADDPTPAPMVALTDAPLSPAQLTSAAAVGQVVAAVYVLDNSGFHGLDEALTGGQEAPVGSLGAVQRAYMVAGATSWPAPLQSTAKALTAQLGTLNAALLAGDSSAAAAAAHEVHEGGHALSRGAYAWLGQVGGLPTAVAGATGGAAGAAAAPAAGD
jgi:uncharacterized protein YcnI